VIHAEANGDTIWVHDDGEVHELEIAAAGGTRSRLRAAHAADLAAPMPAVVRAVLISAGDTVAKGDVLVMLEAMKMELPVRAPRSGTVAGVRCVPGELVQPGVPLVDLA
jgi:biotin carboxyl carrier protein